MAFWLLKVSRKGCDHVFYKYFGQVFGGNVDRHTPVQHSLYSSIQARYLRFHPKTWQGHICMRAEVYGCQEGNLHRRISWISVTSSFSISKRPLLAPPSSCKQVKKKHTNKRGTKTKKRLIKGNRYPQRCYENTFQNQYKNSAGHDSNTTRAFVRTVCQPSVMHWDSATWKINFMMYMLWKTTWPFINNEI